MRRTFVCIVCLILCIFLCMSPAMASTLYESTYTKVSINDNYSFNDSGSYICVDDIEFIGYVLSSMQLNAAWIELTNIIPYSVNRIQFNNSLSSTYSGITVKQQNFRSTGANTGYININGQNFDASITNTFPDYSTDLFFDDSVTLINNNVRFYLQACRVDNTVYAIVADSGNNEMLDAVLHSLDSIQTSLANIQSIDNTSASRLLTIVNSCLAMQADIYNMAVTLNSISNNLNSISNYCSSILTASNETNSILEDTQDYFEQYFPTFDTDLLAINSSISDFRINFNTYATQALMALNQIDDTTQHIDSTLDTMLEMQQGTALQDIPVTGSGGSSISLWSLIKNSVTIGLNATKGLFGGLFDLLSMFGQYSNGFTVFQTVNAYAPISYVPEDYTLLNENMIPDMPLAVYNQAGYKNKITVNGDTIVCEQREGAERGYNRNVVQVTLDPGSYMLYAPGDQRTPISMQTLAGATYGSIVTLTNYPFTVSNQITLNINVGIAFPNPSPATDGFQHGFHLKLVKTG